MNRPSRRAKATAAKKSNAASKLSTSTGGSGVGVGVGSSILPTSCVDLENPNKKSGGSSTGGEYEDNDDKDDEDKYKPKISTVQKRRQKRRAAPKHKNRIRATNPSNLCVIITVFIAILSLVIFGIIIVKVFWFGFEWAQQTQSKKEGGNSNSQQKHSNTNIDSMYDMKKAEELLFNRHDNGKITPIQYPIYPTINRSVRKLPKLSKEAIDMCTQTLWHTIETTTIVLPNRETFVHTGDIDDLWLRDSAAQIHTLLVPLGNKGFRTKTALISNDPQLDRIVAGLIQRTAMYIRHDPYANAFRIDDTYVFSEAQKKMGRHDLISTWNYELDSACYYIRMIWMYWKQSPNADDLNLDSSVLKLPQVMEAVEIMVDLWRSEQRHEDDLYPMGDLFDCVNCNKPYRYPSLPRNGKGTPTNATSGLTWTGFRPSDDECKYHYLVPANMFAVVVLEYVIELSEKVWNNNILAGKAILLAKDIQRGIEEHAIVDHPKYGKIYAYEVDGLGNYLLMDDANVPSLLSIPYLGYQRYDKQIYENTKKFIFSNDNPTYQSGDNKITGHIEGYGSPHMKARIKNNIWPMSIAMQGLVEDDPYEKVRLVELLVKASAGTYWMHESINVARPSDFTRSWFCWADSLFAELVMTLTDDCPNINHKYRVMEWRDPTLIPGGPFAETL